MKASVIRDTQHTVIVTNKTVHIRCEVRQSWEAKSHLNTIGDARFLSSPKRDALTHVITTFLFPMCYCATRTCHMA